MYQYHPNMQSIIFLISIYFCIPAHYYIIYLVSHYSKIQNHLRLTFFPWTNDGFWTLGLDGGTGRGKEAGALHWWMSLFTHWLQKDLILAGKQQAPEADKALLKRKKKKKISTTWGTWFFKRLQHLVRVFPLFGLPKTIKNNQNMSSIWSLATREVDRNGYNASCVSVKTKHNRSGDVKAFDWTKRRGNCFKRAVDVTIRLTICEKMWQLTCVVIFSMALVWLCPQYSGTQRTLLYSIEGSVWTALCATVIGHCHCSRSVNRTILVWSQSQFTQVPLAIH